MNKPVNKTTVLDHLVSIVVLPFNVLVVIPFFIQNSGKIKSSELFAKIDFSYSVVIGYFLLVVGLGLFIASIILFIKLGNGTLAPWKPTQKLVVKSLYRHLRNPMILGVVIILLAESFLFKSVYIMFWAFLFFIISDIYFFV